MNRDILVHGGVIVVLALLAFVLPEYHHGNVARILVLATYAIGYNLLTTRVRELHVQTDNFAQELIAEIQRFYLEDSK